MQTFICTSVDRLTLHKKAKHCRDVRVKLVRVNESLAKSSVNSSIEEKPLRECCLCDYGAKTEDDLTNHLMASHFSEFKAISGDAAMREMK